MKKISWLLIFQMVNTIISATLMSQMSWLGRVGISLFHTEYKILKIWWKSALLIFAIQSVLIFIQWIVKKYTSNSFSRFFILCFLLVGFLGILYTYYDFNTVYEHKILKQKFHIGAYLFWLGWMVTNFYFLFISKNRKKSLNNQVT